MKEPLQAGTTSFKTTLMDRLDEGYILVPRRAILLLLRDKEHFPGTFPSLLALRSLRYDLPSAFIVKLTEGLLKGYNVLTPGPAAK